MTKKPNVIFLMADTLMTSALSCYDSKFISTPNIDAFSKNATIFKNAYQPATQCRPSRTTWFTGCYPSRHQTYSNGDNFSRKEKTLLKYLSQDGYRGGYLGLFHLWEGFDRDGLEDWSWVDYDYDYVENADPEATGPGTRAAYEEYAKENGFISFRQRDVLKDWHHSAGYVDCKEEEYLPNRIVEKALECIDDFSDDQPNFLTVSQWIPHEPWAPHKSYKDKYSVDDVVLPDNVYDDKKGRPEHHRSDDVCRRYLELETEENLKRCWASYACLIAQLDDGVGQIIQKLKDKNIYDESLIVFLTDHGSTMGSHGWLYKGHAYMVDELSRIPLMIKLPGQQESTSIDEVVASVDLLPTLLEYLEIDPSAAEKQDLDGKSLFDLIKTGHRENAVAFGQHGQGDTQDEVAVRMIRKGRWKYNLYNISNTEELYDMQNDPSELNNIVNDSENKIIRKELREELIEYITSSLDKFVVAV